MQLERNAPPLVEDFTRCFNCRLIYNIYIYIYIPIGSVDILVVNKPVDWTLESTGTDITIYKYTLNLVYAANVITHK